MSSWLCDLVVQKLLCIYENEYFFQEVDTADSMCTKKYDKANKELSDAEQALEVENRSYERQIDDRKNRKIAIGNEIKHEREQQNSSNRSRLESERQRNENNILKSKKKLLHFKSN